MKRYVVYSSSIRNNNEWVFVHSYSTRQSAISLIKRLKRLNHNCDFAIAFYRYWDFGSDPNSADKFEIFI